MRLDVAASGRSVSADEAQAQRVAARLGITYVDLTDFPIDHDLFRTIPVELMFRYNFIPWKEEDGRLVVVLSITATTLGSGQYVVADPLPAGFEIENPDLSMEALYFIGGILKHAKALNAITNPATNSYKRLIPGFEAPVLRAYSARNRSGCVRIPWTESPKAKRVEARFPDPAANPYLAFAALMMAGLDGIKNKIDPGPASDKDLYDLPPEEKALVPQVPGSLDRALEALDGEHGAVFHDHQLTDLQP